MRKFILYHQSKLGLLKDNDTKRFIDSTARVRKANLKLNEAQRLIEEAEKMKHDALVIKKSVKADKEHEMIICLNKWNCGMVVRDSRNKVQNSKTIRKRIEHLVNVSHETILKNNVKHVKIVALSEMLYSDENTNIRELAKGICSLILGIHNIVDSVEFVGICHDTLKLEKSKIDDLFDYINTKLEYVQVDNVTVHEFVGFNNITMSIKGNPVSVGTVRNDDAVVFINTSLNKYKEEEFEGYIEVGCSALFDNNTPLPLSQTCVLVSDTDIKALKLKL